MAPCLAGGGDRPPPADLVIVGVKLWDLQSRSELRKYPPERPKCGSVAATGRHRYRQLPNLHSASCATWRMFRGRAGYNIGCDEILADVPPEGCGGG